MIFCITQKSFYYFCFFDNEKYIHLIKNPFLTHKKLCIKKENMQYLLCKYIAKNYHLSPIFKI